MCGIFVFLFCNLILDVTLVAIKMEANPSDTILTLDRTQRLSQTPTVILINNYTSMAL